MAKDEYLVWSNEHRAWWRANRLGYTTSSIKAGKYSRTEAIEICYGANLGMPVTSAPNEIPVALCDVSECIATSEPLHPDTESA